MKFKKTDIGQPVNILANDHYVAINYDCSELSAKAKDGVIPAGTMIPANDATAIGVLLNDVVLEEDPNGAVVVHGFIDKSKLPEEPNEAVDIKQIVFLPFDIGALPKSKETDKAAVMPQDNEPIKGEGSKKVSEMISPDTKILEDGSVEGTLYKVDGFKAFNTSNVAEQSGHFFPFTLSEEPGSKMTFKKNGSESKKDIDYDKDIVFRIDDNQTKFEVLVDGNSVIKLNFEKATLQE